MEPDVTIMVGGQEFLHYSQLLCNCSEYFDAMLCSNMKEAQTKIIKFQDKNPEEWNELSVFIDDPVMAELNQENADDRLLPWFSELRMMRWLARSDKFYMSLILNLKSEFSKAVVGNLKQRRRHGSRLASDIADLLHTSIDYHLSTQMMMLGIVFGQC